MEQARRKNVMKLSKNMQNYSKQNIVVETLSGRNIESTVLAINNLQPPNVFH